MSKILRDKISERLLDARSALLEIDSSTISGHDIKKWFSEWLKTFRQAESLCNVLLEININQNYMQGFWSETDPEIINECKMRILKLIDEAVKEIDERKQPKPILDDLISRVKDKKLHKLLVEFNDSRTKQPNVAGIGFRTILALTIRERAKIIDPESWIAKSDDFKSFEAAIKYALGNDKLFGTGNHKHINRYLNKTLKDALDNVAHKSDYLIETEDLEEAVNLLNKLLPKIVT